jgi:hypothetical protein
MRFLLAFVRSQVPAVAVILAARAQRQAHRGEGARREAGSRNDAAARSGLARAGLSRETVTKVQTELTTLRYMGPVNGKLDQVTLNALSPSSGRTTSARTADSTTRP